MSIESLYTVAIEPHEKVVGLVEIAARLGVPRSTVDQWKWRGIFPAPRWVVGGRPAWDWPDVEEWARATGRPLARKNPTNARTNRVKTHRTAVHW